MVLVFRPRNRASDDVLFFVSKAKRPRPLMLIWISGSGFKMNKNVDSRIVAIQFVYVGT